MAELTALAREAAEIMWEMAALGDRSPASDEMAASARALRAQLRGLISDYTGGDEVALAAGLEAFEMLETTLAEYRGGGDGGGAGAAAPAAALAAVPAAALEPAPAPSAAASNPFAPAAPAVPPPPPATAPAGRAPPGDEAPLISFD